MNLGQFRAYACGQHSAWSETVGPFLGPRGETLSEVLKRKPLIGEGTLFCYMPNGLDDLELDSLVIDGLCRQLKIPSP